MEIVCAPETYRRFESSSLRQRIAPFSGAIFCWYREEIEYSLHTRRFARATRKYEFYFFSYPIRVATLCCIATIFLFSAPQKKEGLCLPFLFFKLFLSYGNFFFKLVYKNFLCAVWDIKLHLTKLVATV